MKNKIIGIQVIRAISAILIVLYHYTNRYNDMDYVAKHDIWAIDLSWGCYAVITFFFISGFLTASNICDNTPPILFLKKRINRLYPTFWIAMIITFIITFLCHMGDVGISDFFINFTMLPQIFGKKPVDGVYWTQQYEIIFYIVVALILYVKKDLFFKYFLLLWIAVSIVSFVYRENSGLIIKGIRVLGLVEYASVFISGLAMGLFFNKRITKKWYITLLLLSLISIYLWKGVTQSVFFIIVCISIWYISNSKITWLNKNNIITDACCWIASISYPLYLIHQKMGYIIMSYIIDLCGIESEWIILLPIFISAFIAYLLHKYVEENKSLRIFNI